MSTLRIAREYLERALEGAEAAHDRKEARFIAFRVCELMEMEDFDEARRLRERDPDTRSA